MNPASSRIPRRLALDRSRTRAELCSRMVLWHVTLELNRLGKRLEEFHMNKGTLNTAERADGLRADSP